MDLVDSDVRVKHMSVLSYATGKLLYLQANLKSKVPLSLHIDNPMPSNPVSRDSLPEPVAIRLLSLATQSFDNALSSDPLNISATVENYIAKTALNSLFTAQ